jgi:hypothetical protein
VAKRKLIEEERRNAKPFVEYFGSSVACVRELQVNFPGLVAHFQDRRTRELDLSHAFISNALFLALEENTPTLEEAEKARLNPQLRGNLRRRFIRGMARAYDKYFPRPGGRLPGWDDRHEMAREKARGCTWEAVSTAGGVFADESKARKAVARDREDVARLYLQLFDCCGPGSDAPAAVKEEFHRLLQIVQQHLPPK